MTITLNDGLSPIVLNDGVSEILLNGENDVTTTVTIQFDHFCASEGHVTVAVTLQGGGTRTFNYDVAELRTPLSWDDAEPIISTLIRAHIRGLTANQSRTELMNGFVLTI